MDLLELLRQSAQIRVANPLVPGTWFGAPSLAPRLHRGRVVISELCADQKVGRSPLGPPVKLLVGRSDYSLMRRASPTTVGVVLLLIVGTTAWEIAAQHHSGAGFIVAWIMLVAGGLSLIAFAKLKKTNDERRRAEAEFATVMAVASYGANRDGNATALDGEPGTPQTPPRDGGGGEGK